MLVIYLYRIVICIVAAHYAGPLLAYFIQGVKIPENTALWACILSVWFLFERLYISVRMEHMMKDNLNEMDRPD